MALGAGVMALLCLGGVGVIVAVYDNATEVKRSDPSEVVFNFLGAYLADRNDQSAALYTCKENSDLSSLSSFRDSIKKSEEKNSSEIVVTWRDLAVQASGDQAVANVNIVRSASDGSEAFDPWKFKLSNNDGWRVCSAAPA
ncbi:Rv0361 family membrane protein [Actinoplanes palleronii]|uniref:Rv0361 family membrane protein n=1 Tax=Actinoplanes palleronii TaxID=113570 RepID=UPI0019415B2C|nr:hypothetical protein [Actinoplanes palleronii]